VVWLACCCTLLRLNFKGTNFGRAGWCPVRFRCWPGSFCRLLRRRITSLCPPLFFLLFLMSFSTKMLLITLYFYC
jgi:hypothetical protein